MWDAWIFSPSTLSLMKHPWFPTQCKGPCSFHLPPYLFPICSISSTLLLLSSVPFNTLAHFPNLFWGIFGCVVGSWMWNVTVADVCSQATEELGLFCVTVSRWPSIRYAPQAAGTSGQWLWRLYVVCGCVLYRALLGLLEVEGRLSKWVKIKKQHLRLFFIWGRPVF